MVFLYASILAYSSHSVLISHLCFFLSWVGSNDLSNDMLLDQAGFSKMIGITEVMNNEARHETSIWKPSQRLERFFQSAFEGPLGVRTAAAPPALDAC